MNTETTQTDERPAILAKSLGINPEEVNLYGADHYGLTIFEADGAEYAIGTDEEADEAVTEAIKESLWAFKASFILGCCGLPYELEEAIEAWQQKKCEGCNDAIEQMIDRTCELDEFVRQAVSSDGRGHFLSQYDGDEIELGNDLYAFRIN